MRFLSFLLVFILAAAAHAQQRLTPDQEKQAGDYARHVFVSMCSNDYWESFSPSLIKNPKEKSALWDHVQTSCGCIAQQVMQIPNIRSSDITDYIMYSYGFEDDKRPDPNINRFLSSPAAQAIRAVQFDPRMRQACGFLTQF